MKKVTTVELIKDGVSLGWAPVCQEKGKQSIMRVGSDHKPIVFKTEKEAREEGKILFLGSTGPFKGTVTTMKVYKFHVGKIHYGFAAERLDLAIIKFYEETNDEFDHFEEIPESEWDDKFINIWEDNDMENEPIKQSIRDVICGTEPQMIFTNDM